MQVATTPRHVSNVPGLNGELARRVARYQVATLIEELKELEPAQWELPTDCDRWRVRDIIAHLIGWMEALTSFRELNHVTVAGFRRRKELGNFLDALNEQQVDERRSMTPEQLVARLEEMAPKADLLRANVARFARFVPLYDPNVAGLTNLGFFANVIFTRDPYMHRVDIARAVGREPVASREDGVLVADTVKDWARRTKADATVTIDDVGAFIAGEGRICTVRGSAADWARVMTKRAQPDVLELGGDTAAALRWLQAGCPF